MLEVARIAKAHGIKGEVIVELITDRTERLEPGAVLSSSEGPMKVLRSQPHQHRWAVAFEGYTTRSEAEKLHGLVLSAEPLDDPNALWVHELIGSVVVDQEGEERGTVTSVIANPASDMLELDTGHLVPLRFVTQQGDGQIVVDVPDGLFDLD